MFQCVISAAILCGTTSRTQPLREIDLDNQKLAAAVQALREAPLEHKRVESLGLEDNPTHLLERHKRFANPLCRFINEWKESIKGHKLSAILQWALKKEWMNVLIRDENCSLSDISDLLRALDS